MTYSYIIFEETGTEKEVTAQGHTVRSREPRFESETSCFFVLEIASKETWGLDRDESFQKKVWVHIYNIDTVASACFLIGSSWWIMNKISQKASRQSIEVIEIDLIFFH